MIKKYSKTLSPKERIPFGYDGFYMMRLYKSPRFLLVWSSLMVIPVTACLLRYFLQPPISIVGFLFVLGLSGGGALAIVSSLMTGEMGTNHGLYLRSQEPCRFWLTMLMCLAVYIFPIVFIWPSLDRRNQQAEQPVDSNSH